MDIDSEMYLRDGAPHATVCRVIMKDGRVGIGTYRGAPENYDKDGCDELALEDAIANLPAAPVTMTATRQQHEHVDYVHVEQEPDVDLQASLGQPARE